MNADRLRAFGKLNYLDPKPILEDLRRIEFDMPGQDIPYRVHALRTNELKHGREIRDAALFVYGMSCVKERDIFFAPFEDQDFDLVASWIDGDTQHFCPVQLKELVPEELNCEASIDDLLAKLTRYVDSGEVTVAIKMNRAGRFEPADIWLPENLNIGGLWMYSAISADQNDWVLWGDFMQAQRPVPGQKFEYPKPMRIAF